MMMMIYDDDMMITRNIIILTTSVNSRRPSVHKRLVTPLFGNGFSAITSLFFVVDRKE